MISWLRCKKIFVEEIFTLSPLFKKKAVANQCDSLVFFCGFAPYCNLYYSL